MISQKGIVNKIARDRKQAIIREVTEKKLSDPNLTAKDKILLVHWNQNNKLGILKRVQAHTLTHVFREKSDFYTSRHHYDWWVFPMHVPDEWRWQQRNYDASITLSDAKILLADPGFINVYTECVARYIEALETHGWNDYPVRYARMLQSLSLFMQAAREMECDNSVYGSLYLMASHAIDFAKENVLKSYPEYFLLIDGFHKTHNEVARFSHPERSISITHK